MKMASKVDVEVVMKRIGGFGLNKYSTLAWDRTYYVKETRTQYIVRLMEHSQGYHLILECWGHGGNKTTFNMGSVTDAEALETFVESLLRVCRET